MNTQKVKLRTNKTAFAGILHLFFNLKKSATEALLSEAYPEYAPEVRECQLWFARFKSADFNTEDKERSGPSKKFEDHELQALLDQDP